MRRVAFLFSSEMSQEFRDVEDGIVPSHRVFGAADVELPDVEVVWFRWPARWPTRWRSARVWRVVQAFALLRARDVQGAVCTTEASAPPVLALRAFGLLRCRVIVVNVAMLKPTNTIGLRRRLMSFLVRRADLVVSYARSQVKLVVETFAVAAEKSAFVPFGVDTRYFSPDVVESRGTFTLMVGTNRGKDLPTLMRAVSGTGPCLVVTDEWNIADARRVGVPSDVNFVRDVPILELRRLYRAASRIVIPLREGSESSGQTVLLENLVMGNRVIVSDVSYIRDYVTDETAVLVGAGDVDALRAELTDRPERIHPVALDRARNDFAVSRLARALASLALGTTPLVSD